MPRVRVPVRRSGYRYTARPGRRYPTAAPSGGRGLLGGLAGLLLCLLCLATLGLLGLFAAFVAVTAYLGGVYRALKSAGSNASGNYVNMAILLGALSFAGYHKLRRSL
jgi:predicted lipid-binding transport protein (Tim44 family)